MKKPSSVPLSRLKQPLALDFQATTPCEREVLEAMEPFWYEFWGNASSSQNRYGLCSAAAVSVARDQIASFFGINSEKIIFTSGATEANNLALLGHARAMASKRGKPGHLITLQTEHHAVLQPLRQLQREGFRLTELQPSCDGLLSLDQLADAFEDETVLVSVMGANNEIGVIQPLKEISNLCRDRGVSLHSDLVQAFGHWPLDLSSLDIDFLSLSAHKIYGPKGIGALVLDSELPLLPIQWGGGQEQGLRPGTLPVPLIVGFAKAAELALNDLNDRHFRLKQLREQLLNGLREKIPDLKINGSTDKRLSHNLNITIPGVLGHQLHQKLRPVIACSSGSTCSRGNPSHVLKALGRSADEAKASLRLSLGRYTTFDEIKTAIELISEVVLELRQD